MTEYTQCKLTTKLVQIVVLLSSHHHGQFSITKDVKGMWFDSSIDINTPSLLHTTYYNIIILHTTIYVNTITNTTQSCILNILYIHY